MSNDLVKREVYSLAPTTFQEMQDACALVAQSALIPEVFRGKPADIFVAASLGQELGLSFLQSLQGIAVINGRPTVWGDHAVALVRSSGLCEYIDDTWDEQTLTATCRVKRKGEPMEIVRTFSLADAQRAGLDQKTGPWKGYDQRMCAWRARSWALRDGFADVLRGIGIREEMIAVVENPDNDRARVEADIPMPRATDAPASAAPAQIEHQAPGRTVSDVIGEVTQRGPEPVLRAAAPTPAAPAAEAVVEVAPQAAAPLKLSGKQWQERCPNDPRIVDPDGWRSDGLDYETAPIERAEYEERLLRCTVMDAGGGGGAASEPELPEAERAGIAREILAQAEVPTDGPYSAMSVQRVTSRKTAAGAPVFWVYLADQTNTEMKLATLDQDVARAAAQARVDGKTVAVRFVISTEHGWEISALRTNP